MNTFFALVAVAVGMALVVFRRPFAQRTIAEQNRTWGFRFGKREERYSRFLAVVVGVGFMAWGIAVLSGLLR